MIQMKDGNGSFFDGQAAAPEARKTLRVVLMAIKATTKVFALWLGNREGEVKRYAAYWNMRR